MISIHRNMYPQTWAQPQLWASPAGFIFHVLTPCSSFLCGTVWQVWTMGLENDSQQVDEYSNSMQNLFVWVSIVSMLVFSGIVMFIIEGTWILLKCPGLGLTHSFFRLIIQEPCILCFDCLYLLVYKTL